MSKHAILPVDAFPPACSMMKESGATSYKYLVREKERKYVNNYEYPERAGKKSEVQRGKRHTEAFRLETWNQQGT
jgi:hypothetical protein